MSEGGREGEKETERGRERERKRERERERGRERRYVHSKCIEDEGGVPGKHNYVNFGSHN